MVATIVISIIIILYVIIILNKKIKDLKKGKFCSCNCDHCSAKCKQ